MRLVLLLGLLASGCVHTRPVPLDTDAGRADLNARTAGHTATLHVRGAAGRSVRNLHVGPDETTWVNRISGQPESAPTADVSAISMRRGSLRRSALIGAGIGAAVGLLLATAPCRDFVCFSPAFFIGGSTVEGVAIGAFVGTAQSDRFVNDARLGVRLDTLARP